MSQQSNVPTVVAPSPTPFDAADQVDFDAIERNVARWLDTPLSGFVLGSENGEEAFLSEQERVDIVRTVRRVSGDQRLLIAGVDCPSALETLRQADALVAAGAEVIRVRVPRLTDNVAGYFEQVLQRLAAPALVIHQMAPGTFLGSCTEVGAEPAVLADTIAHENVYGYVASADLRFEGRVRRQVSGQKPFWVCNAGILLAGAAIGANGACMMLGNVAPRECQEVLRLTIQSDLESAREIQMRLLAVDWQILSYRAAGLKAALNLLGYEAGVPRQPAQPCSESQQDEIRQALIEAGILPS